MLCTCPFLSCACAALLPARPLAARLRDNYLTALEQGIPLPTMAGLDGLGAAPGEHIAILLEACLLCSILHALHTGPVQPS